MARITVETISNKEFSFEPRGYNMQEVDSFLDEICDEMERMDSEIRDLRQKTTAVVAPAAPAANPASDTFREILEMAAQVKDETIRKAREDAEAIRNKAEVEARERLDGLAEERESLEAEVARLKEAATAYRTKFEALLQAQQEAMEKAADLF